MSKPKYRIIPEDVKSKIYELWQINSDLKQLAIDFGISYSHVCKIVTTKLKTK